MRNAVVYKKLNLGICGPTQGVWENLTDAVRGKPTNNLASEQCENIY